MNSKKVLYGTGIPNDEAYTPRYAIEPLLEFIPRGKIIWCPFDTEESQYVKVLTEYGHQVIYTHRSLGLDFMICPEPSKWDMIISNPPFTNKRLTFERALSLEKPFALLMTNTWLNDSAPKQLFEHKDLQLLMFDKRIKFGNQVQKGITFSSSYFCYNFLPKQIIMRRLIIPKL